jgi:branched-chain amino acid transport system permease protein
MDYIIYIGTLIAIYSTLTISLNLLVGYTGLLSLAQAGLYGLGAYITALLALNVTPDLLLALLLSVIGGVILAALISLVALKLSTEYFLIATLGLEYIIYSLFMNLDITQGPVGLYGIPAPTLFGWQVGSSTAIFVLTAILAAVCYFFSQRITNSPFGRTLRAIREDQVAVAALGKSVFRFKFAIFLFSAAFAAAAGTIYAFSLTAIDPYAFNLNESIFIITIVIVGGTGNLNGSILAAFLLILLPETFKFLNIPAGIAPELRQVLYGLILVLFTRFRRRGLIGEYKDGLK